MKGGSVASSGVVDLVNAGAYEKLDAQFDNAVGGGLKKKMPREKANKQKTLTDNNKNKTEKPNRSKKTNKTNNSNKAVKTEKKPHVLHGGMCPMCGGRMKHMNEYDDTGLFNLYNKKGGANQMFDMKYDYNDAMAQSPHGPIINRSVNEQTTAMLANDSPSTLGGLVKSVQFGNVFDTSSVPFTYNGGKGKKTVLKTAKKGQTKSNK
jgi:hypothetical protein